MKVKDKIILVTGGGNGLGRELVLNLLSKDAKVIAVDINEAALQETMELAGNKKDQLTTFIIDITKRVAVEELLNKVISSHGFIDGLINNAGIIQHFQKVSNMEFNEIERVFGVNYWGTMNMARLFLPILLKRPTAHIVNISSMGGFLPVPGQTIYGASKAAVKIFTEGLHLELLETNVGVTVVFPGAVKTNIKRNSGLENKDDENPENTKKKITTPSQAAEIIIAAMEKNRSRVFVGKDSKFMHLYYNLFPGSASRLMYRMLKNKI